MTVLIVLIGVFLLLIIGSLLLAMLVFNQAKAAGALPPAPAVPPVKFNLKYVALPLIAVALTVILIAVNAGRLPPQVGYSFGDGGAPTAWMSRGRLIMLTLLPQMLLIFLSLIVVWGVTRLGNIFQSAGGGKLPAAGLLVVMGNIIGLPMLIIIYAMAGIYTYNAFSITLPPLWIITVALMAVAGIILTFFFINLMRKMGSITLKDE